MPTLLPQPWPSGPVVVSTPAVCLISGWPGVRLPHWRKLRISSSGSDGSSSDFAVGRHFADAGQVHQRVEQHRRMAAGEDEAIAVRPERRGRIVAQVLRPQLIGDRREGHRRAGMAAVGRLDGVHRQRADRVDGRLFDAFGDGGHEQFAPPAHGEKQGKKGRKLANP